MLNIFRFLFSFCRVILISDDLIFWSLSSRVLVFHLENLNCLQRLNYGEWLALSSSLCLPPFISKIIPPTSFHLALVLLGSYIIAYIIALVLLGSYIITLLHLIITGLFWLPCFLLLLLSAIILYLLLLLSAIMLYHKSLLVGYLPRVSILSGILSQLLHVVLFVGHPYFHKLLSLLHSFIAAGKPHSADFVDEFQ